MEAWQQDRSHMLPNPALFSLQFTLRARESEKVNCGYGHMYCIRKNHVDFTENFDEIKGWETQ